MSSRGSSGTGPNTNADEFIVRFDASGQVVWSDHVGGSSYDVFNGVVRTHNGFMVVGATYSFGAGNGSDMYICKFNANGNHLFTRTFMEQNAIIAMISSL
ncbi:MAG: hypothetical protein R3C61_01320 [Bacteroidia bacterium]